MGDAPALPATVAAVGSVGADGAVQVLLALETEFGADGRPDLEAAHSVEVRVGQVTPAELFLRAAGRGR